MRNRDSGSGGVAGVLLAAATVLGGWAITAGETAMVVGRVVAPIVTAGAPVTLVNGLKAGPGALAKTAAKAAKKSATKAKFDMPAYVAPKVVPLKPGEYRLAFLPQTSAMVREAKVRPDGTFIDDYTGKIIERKEVSVDHIIPLSEARDVLGVNTEAYWAFANDPLNLAVTSVFNNSKEGKKGLLDSTAMFPEAQVDITAIGRQVREKYWMPQTE
jgi:hypothetical protein